MADGNQIPVTEERNPRTLDIDTLSSLDILRAINREDHDVAPAVAEVLPALARLVDEATERCRRGGRLHYFGAGSSGRIAVLDAAELPPTFGVGPEFATAHLAGGEPAIRRAVENAEDDVAAGRRDGQAVGAGDVAIGLSASGSAPYVAGALREARRRKAFTALISAVPAAPLGAEVDLHLGVATGPEALTGSTRMKAGTAEKLMLNAFSTALMIRLGRCYSNVMVDLVATNRKLRGRQVRILEQTTGAPPAQCRDALAAAGGDVKVALVGMLSGADPATSRRALTAHEGRVRSALVALTGAAAGTDGASP
ncbi:MAG TPA: N-acetylmuramic acid 6-phosphate etherase [Acidimicrobiales bacterium]|nr:N-acetylmuramic acid 6-phosphate etherase [Acidimicrobiales bacterium]